jgi:hypothetical protein
LYHLNLPMNSMNALLALALYMKPKLIAITLEICLRWVSKQHNRQAKTIK